MTRFVDFEAVRSMLHGKSIAIVGSGPGCLDNTPGYVDAHEVVVRVNNHKCGAAQGLRTDIHFSFYGTSIKVTADDLKAQGCYLCMSKLPNSSPIPQEFRWWHERNGKTAGIDYRYIYSRRATWWFTDTFIPDDARFLTKFRLLRNHQPTTGFAAILDVLECEPTECLLTGFDFFASGVHNVDEAWGGKDKNLDDPIRHRPDLELKWLRENIGRFPITTDKRLAAMLQGAE